jgi:hypothetical protein
MRRWRNFLAITAIVTGITLPLMLYLISDKLPIAISLYHYGETGDYYRLALGVVATIFIVNKRFMLPGILLMGSTYFNMEEYLVLHNILAILFFLSIVIRVIDDLKLIQMIAIISIIILSGFCNLYITEVILIEIFAIYNIFLLIKENKKRYHNS